MVALRAAGLLVGVGGLAALYVLVDFYPAFPKSVAGWVAVLFIAFPFLVVAEWAGSVIFGAKSLANLSPALRVSLGVVMALAFLAVFLPIAVLIAGLINT